MKLGIFFSFFFLFSTHAFAYVPPAHAIAKKIAAAHPDNKQIVVRLSISKPSAENKSSEKTLWTYSLLYPQTEAKWPTFAMLFESNADQLLNSWKRFGLPLPTEAELVSLSPEDIAKSPELPNPFYKKDDSVSLRRWQSKIAWLISDSAKMHAIGVEKDTFLPLFINGACPAMIHAPTCSVEFIRTAQGPKLLVKHDKQIDLIVKVDKVISKPSPELLAQTEADNKTFAESNGGSDGFSIFEFFFL